MAVEKARPTGTGRAGSHSSRYAYRAEVKEGAKVVRRREDHAATMVTIDVAIPGSTDDDTGAEDVGLLNS